MALAETMWPEEFLSTPDRKEEEEKLVAVRNIPLVWGEEEDWEEKQEEEEGQKMLNGRRKRGGGPE